MAGSDAPARLWGGRFEGAPDAIVERLNNSFAFDCRLWPDDIEAGIAHAEMLGATGIIAAEEAERIASEMRRMAADLEAERARLDPRSEDVHTAVEALLRERIGPVAGKLHTARSRNDQVATDLRMYLKRAKARAEAGLRDLQRALVETAERHPAAIMPGYTHLQHAQPVLLSHHLLAYYWMFARDRGRLEDWLERADEMPLGCGAIAGTGFSIDRHMVARKLGFSRLCANSMDAVSDRDFVIEFLSAAALTMVHCSRLGEELILWSSPEFGFVTLADAVTTGSSIMPQKKNPDVAELARGKAGRVIGDLVALLTTLKGLPLTYNKDLQEDKEALFDATDTLEAVLPALALAVRTAEFDLERMRRATDGDFSTATDLADALVRHGMPFREAHAVVGRLVRTCIGKGLRLEQLTAAEISELAPEIGPDVAPDLTSAGSVAARSAPGGTSPDAVADQLRLAREALEG